MNELFTKHPKVTYNNLKVYCHEAMKYPPNFMEYKNEKQWKVVERASKAWHHSLVIHSALHQMNASYLLGENEYVVKPFIKECAMLSHAVAVFESETKRVSKESPDVVAYYKDLLKALDRKEIVTWMLQDIEYWENEYAFSCGMDKKEQVEFFKKELEVLKNNEKV